MNMISALRYGAAACAFVGLTVLALSTGNAQGQAAVPQDGKLGFVVSSIRYAVTDVTDPNVTCPNGLSTGPLSLLASNPELARREGENEGDYQRRIAGPAIALLSNSCMNPEAGGPDPNLHPVSGDVDVYGIDLDGQVSRANGRAAPGTCAHNDFRGVNGVRGVDNQFYRAVGCTRTLQPGGQANDFGSGMLVGEWGILISLEDVQDLRNDNDVVVHFYANADPMQLSPTREPLINATYALERDPRFQATTHGRIVNGVLTTNPVDARFHWVVNSLRLERPLSDARLRMTINADGSLEGIMAGYSPVEEIYDTVFGFRTGRDGSGNLAPVRARAGSAGGYAGTAGHTCNGVYFALKQMADGHRDPATGQCTAISTQYRVRAIPAFVVDAQTRSLNQDLVH